MTLQTMTLNVPEVLYKRLKRRAEQANRTVEAELLDVLVAAVPVSDDLPDDLAEALSSLALLDDEALRRAARSQLVQEATAQLEELHFKRQREGLTEAEVEAQSRLV